MHQYFLIVVTLNVKNVSESLNNIFDTLMIFDLLRVNVLINHGNSWSLYYYKPYIDNCDSFKILKIVTFENFMNALSIPFGDLFPPRQFKFHHCKVNISTFAIEPYVIIKNQINGTFEYSGVDIMIAKEICQTLNLIPTFLQSLDGKASSPDGAIKMVKFYKLFCIITTCGF